MATLTESDFVTLVSSEMDREIGNFQRIMTHLMDKMKHDITALNAQAPHTVLNAAVTRIGNGAMAKFTALKQLYIDRVPDVFQEKAERGKSKSFIVLRHKHFCKHKTLEMWKLASDADIEMKVHVAEHFPHYKFDRHTISVALDDVEHFLDRKPISAEAWKSDERVEIEDKLVEGFLAKMSEIVGQFKRDYAESKSKVATIIDNLASRYAEHGIKGQSITVQSFYDDLDNTRGNIDSAERELKTRSDLKLCLQSENDVGKIEVCLERAIDAIKWLNIDALTLTESFGYIVHELASFQ